MSSEAMKKKMHELLTAHREERLQAEPEKLASVTPNASEGVRYAIIAEGRNTLERLAREKVTNKAIGEYRDESGRTWYKAYVNRDVARHIANDVDLSDVPAAIPHSHLLASSDGFSLASVEAPSDANGLQDVLLVRSRSENPNALLNMLQSSRIFNHHTSLHPAQDGEPGWVCAVRLHPEVMRSIKNHPGNAITPLEEYPDIKADAGLLDRIGQASDGELASIAAEHLPAKPIIPQAVGRKPAEPKPKQEVVAKPLEEYAHALRDADIRFQRQRKFDGSYGHYILIDGAKTGIVETLKDRQQCTPRVDLQLRGGRKVGESERRYERYVLSEEAFRTLDEITGRQTERHLADAPYMLQEAEVGVRGMYSDKGHFNTSIDQLVITRDPEDASQCLLYVVATADDKQQSHRRLASFNKEGGIQVKEGAVKRVTAADSQNKQYEHPAIQRMQIPREVANDIVSQKKNEPENREVFKRIIDDRREGYSDKESRSEIDQMIRRDCDVVMLERKEEKETTEDTGKKGVKSQKRPLTEDEQTQQLNRFVKGLGAIAKLHKQRGVDPPLILQALVHEGGVNHREIICRLSYKERQMLRDANTQEADGKTYTYAEVKEENAVEGKGNDTIVRMRVPGNPLPFERALSQSTLRLRYAGVPEASGRLSVAWEERTPFNKAAQFVSRATGYFEGELQRLKNQEDALLTEEQRAFRALLSRDVKLVEVKHPTEEEFARLQDLLTTLQSMKEAMPGDTDRYRKISEIAEEAEKAAGIIDGLPESMREIKIQSRKVAVEIERLEQMIEPWKDVVLEQSAFARAQANRQSTMIVALEVTSDETLKQIQGLWKPGGNQQYLLRPPEIRRHAVNGRHVVLLFPTQHGLNEIQAYDRENRRSNMQGAGHSEAEVDAEVARGMRDTWQPVTEQPVHAFELMKFLKKLSAEKGEDLYDKLEVMVDKKNVRETNRLLSEALRGDLSKELREALVKARDANRVQDKYEYTRQAIHLFRSEEERRETAPDISQRLRTLETSLSRTKPLLLEETYEMPDHEAIEKKLNQDLGGTWTEIVPSEPIQPQAVLILPVRNDKDVRAVRSIYTALNDAEALIRPLLYGDESKLIDAEPEEEKEEGVVYKKVDVVSASGPLTDMEGETVPIEEIDRLVPNAQEKDFRARVQRNDTAPCVKLYVSGAGYRTLHEMMLKKPDALFSNKDATDKICQHNKGAEEAEQMPENMLDKQMTPNDLARLLRVTKLFPCSSIRI